MYLIDGFRHYPPHLAHICLLKMDQGSTVLLIIMVKLYSQLRINRYTTSLFLIGIISPSPFDPTPFIKKVQKLTISPRKNSAYYFIPG